MRILSGGQTGVDRGALDAAIASHIDYGGWCPKGGWAEDAPTPPGLWGNIPTCGRRPPAIPASAPRGTCATPMPYWHLGGARRFRQVQT